MSWWLLFACVETEPCVEDGTQTVALDQETHLGTPQSVLDVVGVDQTLPATTADGTEVDVRLAIRVDGDATLTTFRPGGETSSDPRVCDQYYPVLQVPVRASVEAKRVGLSIELTGTATRAATIYDVESDLQPSLDVVVLPTPEQIARSPRDSVDVRGPLDEDTAPFPTDVELGDEDPHTRGTWTFARDGALLEGAIGWRVLRTDRAVQFPEGADWLTFSEP